MIYFDNAATTKPCPEAIAAMTDALSERWANPSSVHAAGNTANALLTESRAAVLKALGVRRQTEGRLIFTGSGTEADNLALLGTVYAKTRPVRGGSRGRILITEGEHAAIEQTAARLEKDGFEICRIPTHGGEADLDYVRDHAEGVILVSTMLVNNETGALYDVRRIFDTVRSISPDAITHTDAVQGFMKVRFTPASLGADLISISGHKIEGPKGIGALYVAEGILRAKKLIPTVTGGGQEGGYRSGTENMPGIAGFAAACRAAMDSFAERAEAVAGLRARLLENLAAHPSLRVNHPASAADHIVSVTMPGVRSETVLNDLSSKGICISAGSACSAHAPKKASRALLAFGLSAEEADTTVRVSLSHTNTEQEIDVLTAALADAAQHLAKRR